MCRPGGEDRFFNHVCLRIDYRRKTKENGEFNVKFQKVAIISGFDIPDMVIILILTFIIKYQKKNYLILI